MPRAKEGGSSPVVDGGVPFADLLAAVHPPADRARDFYADGSWRAQTVLHDVYRGAAIHPHRAAVVAHRAHQPAPARIVRVSYGQLASYTERFAYALDALGIGPGDPVAFQLPDRWETCALLLACLRTGAVAVPVMTGYGARDLKAALEAAQPRVCVVPDRWEGIAPAEIVADLAPALPWLRHRVVLGDAAATGAVSFVRHFVRTPHERHHHTAGRLPLQADIADRITVILTTLGLHGSHHMALHSLNTLHAGVDRAADGAGYSALPLPAPASLLHTLLAPLARGAAAVLQDVWDADAALEVMAASGARTALATPAQWAELAAAQRQQPRALTSLRQAISSDPAGAATGLVREIQEALRVPLTALSGPATGEGNEPGGDGRPRVRGPASPLAVWRRESGGLRPTWRYEGPSGPGDFAGLAAGGRPAPAAPVQEIGGVFLVPVTEVEEQLMKHPAIAEAAVVACTDPEHGELACVVVVPSGDPPTLTELRGHLLDAGTAPAHLPGRLELMGALPRTDSGTVRRGELRRLLGSRLSAL
ncbi:AMP-binding protein [Streptomyces boninensis]|uniref:AMP-binding protein n=1 Tax=Streptomyces boninensis TaxID=2039455 RepID=UPI003B21C7E3